MEIIIHIGNRKIYLLFRMNGSLFDVYYIYLEVLYLHMEMYDYGKVRPFQVSVLFC